MTLRDKFKQTIQKYHLLQKGDKVLVAVSGGADSVTLLYLLDNLRKELRLKLHIAHLDHQLRKDSYKDRRFVENLARRLKLSSTATQIEVERLAKKGSLEEVARNTRLGFLFRVAREVKADKIALGHNLDDQAETVLMRILRGAGLSGLSGISAKRKICGWQIIRPLIELRRKDIEAFLKKKKIRPRLDASNLEDIYFRNKIRNKLLPLLEREYNSNIKELLSNMAESAGYDYDYLNKVADLAMKRLSRKINLVNTKKYFLNADLRKSNADKRRFYNLRSSACNLRESALKDGFSIRINLEKFLKLHPAMQRMVLRLNIARLKGDTRRITHQHIKEIEDLILSRPINSIVDLPKGISVVKKNRYFVFYRKR